MQCKFEIAWKGQCEEKAIPGSEYCEKHSKKICCSCGEKATHQCPETMVLVCGASLCDNCEDELSPFGTSTGRHCKKEDQKYTSWVERSDEDQNKIRNDQAIPYFEGQIYGAEIASILSEGKIDDKVSNFIEKKKQELYEYMKNSYPSAIKK